SAAAAAGAATRGGRRRGGGWGAAGGGPAASRCPRGEGPGRWVRGQRGNARSKPAAEPTPAITLKRKGCSRRRRASQMRMEKRPDGTYDGEVTPTQFAFSSDKLIYPLKITQISVKERTEALFYVQAAGKMDLGGDFSWEYSFTPMWSQATSFAVPEKLTQQE